MIHLWIGIKKRDKKQMKNREEIAILQLLELRSARM